MEDIKDIYKIKISGKEKIKDIQHSFNKLYPFLKINFFKGILKEEINEVNSEKSVDQFLKDSTICIINMGYNKTIAEVEKDFLEKLGLSIQILRKTGNHWIETSLTNNWTLKQQNEEGEMLI